MRRQETIQEPTSVNLGRGGSLERIAKKPRSTKGSILKAVATLLTGGLLAAALPVANAETYTFGTAAQPVSVKNIGDTGSVLGGPRQVWAGVALGTAANDAAWWNVDAVPVADWEVVGNPIGVGNHIFDLRNVNFNFGAGAIDLGVNDVGAAVLTDRTSSTFRLGDISITGQATSGGNSFLNGFMVIDVGPFSGKIEGSNVNVTATTGEALGVHFRATNGGKMNIVAGADIKFDTIDVVASTLVIDPNDSAWGFAAGAVANNAKIDVKAINAMSVTNQAAAASFAGDVGGSLNFGTLAADSGGHHAMGFVMGDRHSAPLDSRNVTSTGEVKIGTVDVISRGSQAWGVDIYGAVQGSLKVDSIAVEAVVGNAVGMVIENGVNGLNVNNTATVTVGDTSVKAGGTAAGLVVGNVGQFATVNVNGLTKAFAEGNAVGLTIGNVVNGVNGGVVNVNDTVRARSDNGNAAGIILNSGTINLNADVFAVAFDERQEAAGIITNGHSTIALGKNVYVIGSHLDVDRNPWTGNMSENRGFLLDGLNNTTTTVDTKGYTLITNGVESTQGANFTVRGSGKANLGIVKMNGAANGNLIIGQAAVVDKTKAALDIVHSTLGGANVLHGGSTLVVYGEWDSKNANPGNGFNWRVDPAVDPPFTANTNVAFTGTPGGAKGNLYSGAIFTGYEFIGGAGADRDQIRAYVLDEANMSDGFVIAMGMTNRFGALRSARDHMISGKNYNGFRGQICDPCGPLNSRFCDPCDMATACDPCDPCGDYNGCGDGCCGNGFSFGRGGFGGSDARNTWVAYTGRSDQFATSYKFNKVWRLSAEGVQVGTDLFRTNRTQFGLLFGYEGGRATSDNWLNNTTNRVNMDDYSFGFYGARVLRGGADVRTIVAFGWQDFDMTRRWDINALDLYTAKFKGRSTAATFELGKRVYSGAWSMRPVMALDMLSNRVRSANEVTIFEINSGEQAVAYGKGKFTQAFLRIGSDLRLQARKATLNSGLYYAYDANGSQLTAPVRGISAGNDGLTADLVGGKFGRSMLTYNIGGDIQVAQYMSIFGGYEGTYFTDRPDRKVAGMGHVGLGVYW